MCGIFCEFYKSDTNPNNLTGNDNIFKRIVNRGPDCVEHVTRQINSNTNATFFGSVLWMQGPTIISQPIEDNHGILLYNGDIFDDSWPNNKSDTLTIKERFNACYEENLINYNENIIKLFKSMKGPFSLVYFEKLTKKVFFTRDRIGRNSLLFHENDNSIVFSSVLDRKYKAYEIPANHIHILDLEKKTIEMYSWEESEKKKVSLASWVQDLQEKQSLSDEKFKFDYEVSEDLNDHDNVIEFIDKVIQNNECKRNIMEKILENKVISKTIEKLTELLNNSVRLRLLTQPQKCKQCIELDITSCGHCTVGVLFSGGLDCTLLAYLADKYLPADQPIDLINVAFNKNNTEDYDVPDRLTGDMSFAELKTVCPERNWVYRKVNVPIEELLHKQNSTVADLVYPRQTILDESLGTALWFAARGMDDEGSSSCRVLILGSGADELFGGYTRHRNAFKRHGWLGLQKELMLDWKRISYRNLARDNRVICDHGRQPRMPYLDEDFTSYVLSLKPWLRCYPSETLRQGLGDKLMLRLIAFQCGLHNVSTFPKRALQFGSRIANKKEKGSDISMNLTCR